MDPVILLGHIKSPLSPLFQRGEAAMGNDEKELIAKLPLCKRGIEGDLQAPAGAGNACLN
jgi:hypothetical protein